MSWTLLKLTPYLHAVANNRTTFNVAKTVVHYHVLFSGYPPLNQVFSGPSQWKWLRNVHAPIRAAD